jgi:signal transduction histidine kinase
MTVVDDGIGVLNTGQSEGRGLDNMSARASKLGGSCDIRPTEPTGTAVDWRVPLRA